MKLLQNRLPQSAAKAVPCATVSISASEGLATVNFAGKWIISENRQDVASVASFLNNNFVKTLKFDMSALEAYDSILISNLLLIYNVCTDKNIEFKFDSIPLGQRSLLKLAVAVPEGGKKKDAILSQGIIKDIGYRTINMVDAVNAQAEFIGEVTISAGKTLRGRSHFRLCDLLLLIQRAGPEALPIVGLISFLVGLIIGFVGVIQLAAYGSEIFVADLVGIATVRELGAIMVGVVMAGRTGAAYAAEIGTMKVNEELSAFRTFGISPMEFLVIPRIIALVLVFPLLTIFADVIGIIGGLVVSVGLSDISAEQYINRTMAALTLVQISTGVGKSLVFGFIVACVGCRMGLQTENSSAGVGLAATSSVVQSITFIIVADAIFAVLFTIFNI